VLDASYKLGGSGCITVRESLEVPVFPTESESDSDRANATANEICNVAPTHACAPATESSTKDGVSSSKPKRSISLMLSGAAASAASLASASPSPFASTSIPASTGSPLPPASTKKHSLLRMAANSLANSLAGAARSSKHKSGNGTSPTPSSQLDQRASSVDGGALVARPREGDTGNPTASQARLREEFSIVSVDRFYDLGKLHSFSALIC